MTRVTLLAGAVWHRPALATWISAPATVEGVANALWWLPRREGRRVARAVLNQPAPVLAGWYGTLTGPVAAPAERWEVIGTSFYGDPVYLSPSGATDPLYGLQGQVFMPYYVAKGHEDENP